MIFKMVFSQNEITEETTEEPVVGNESGGEPPAER